MKNFLLGLFIGLSFLGATAYGLSTYLTTQGGTGTTTPSGILYGDNGSTSHLNTVNIGSNLTFTNGTLSATGGSGGTVVGTISTSTANTINQILYYTNTGGYPAKVSGVATSSIGADGTSLSFSGTAGSQIGGANGTYSLNLGNSNTWTVNQSFNYSSSTAYSSFVTASTTNLIVNGSSFKSLTGTGLTNSSGVLTVSAVPNSALSNSTISGVALGGTLANHSTNASLSGTAYNGSAAVSDWGLNLANSNTWSVLQNFNYSSSTLYSTFNVASSTNLFAGFFTLATSTAGCLNVNGSGVVYSKACSSSGTVTSITLGDNLFGTTPLTTSGTIYGAVGTSSVPTVGNLAYWTGVGDGTHGTKLGTVATSSIGAGTGLTFSGTAGAQVGGTAGTYSVNSSQSIATLSNLATNGFVTTSGGVGTLGVQAFPVTVAQGGTNKTVLSPASLLWSDTAGTSILATSTITINNLYATSSLLSTFVGGLSLATTTSWLNSIQTNVGTTTISGQLNSLMASSSALAATYNVDWSQGNKQTFIINQTSAFTINATSSNPIDGGAYAIDICQDGTGSRAVTWATPAQLVWSNGTTTIASGANQGTWIMMIYKARLGRYDVVASSTITDTRTCKP